jgi:hypothetical protein
MPAKDARELELPAPDGSPTSMCADTKPFTADKKADAPFTIPMPGTSSRERDVRPYTRGFEDESRPREADRDIAVSATGRSPSFSQTACQAGASVGPTMRF